MTFKTMRQHVHAATTGAYVAALADKIKRAKEGAGCSVYQTSGVIDPFDDEHCSCGAELAYDPEGGNESLFHTGRLRARCEACGKAFEPSERLAIVRDPCTDEESELRGGATFRFAVVVDCGKCWPQDESGFGAHEELRELCESHFGQAFYEVVDVD